MITHQLALGLWRAIYPGVYQLGVVPTWETSLSGAVLAGGPSCFASHRSAGRLHALDGCRTDRIEITSSRYIRWDRVIAHRCDLPLKDVMRVRGIRATRPTRTLLDLAATLDLLELEAALDSALVRGLTSTDHLARRLQEVGGRGRRGTVLLRRLLSARTEGQAPTESELERLFDREVTNRFGLPVPAFQHKVLVEGGHFRLDFAYPHLLLGIELLGWRFHQGKKAWEKDLQRHNCLTSAGWTILYFTWTDVTRRSSRVAHEIQEVLRRRENVLFTDEHL